MPNKGPFSDVVPFAEHIKGVLSGAKQDDDINDILERAKKEYLSYLESHPDWQQLNLAQKDLIRSRIINASIDSDGNVVVPKQVKLPKPKYTIGERFGVPGFGVDEESPAYKPLELTRGLALSTIAGFGSTATGSVLVPAIGKLVGSEGLSSVPGGVKELMEEAGRAGENVGGSAGKTASYVLNTIGSLAPLMLEAGAVGKAVSTPIRSLLKSKPALSKLIGGAAELAAESGTFTLGQRATMSDEEREAISPAATYGENLLTFGFFRGIGGLSKKLESKYIKSVVGERVSKFSEEQLDDVLTGLQKKAAAAGEVVEKTPMEKNAIRATILDAIAKGDVSASSVLTFKDKAIISAYRHGLPIAGLSLFEIPNSESLAEAVGKAAGLHTGFTIAGAIGRVGERRKLEKLGAKNVSAAKVADIQEKEQLRELFGKTIPQSATPAEREIRLTAAEQAAAKYREFRDDLMAQQEKILEAVSKIGSSGGLDLTDEYKFGYGRGSERQPVWSNDEIVSEIAKAGSGAPAARVAKPDGFDSGVYKPINQMLQFVRAATRGERERAKITSEEDFKYGIDPERVVSGVIKGPNDHVYPVVGIAVKPIKPESDFSRLDLKDFGAVLVRVNVGGKAKYIVTSAYGALDARPGEPPTRWIANSLPEARELLFKLHNDVSLRAPGADITPPTPKGFRPINPAVDVNAAKKVGAGVADAVKAFADNKNVAVIPHYNYSRLAHEVGIWADLPGQSGKKVLIASLRPVIDSDGNIGFMYYDVRRPKQSAPLAFDEGINLLKNADSVAAELIDFTNKAMQFKESGVAAVNIGIGTPIDEAEILAKKGQPPERGVPAPREIKFERGGGQEGDVPDLDSINLSPLAKEIYDEIRPYIKDKPSNDNHIGILRAIQAINNHGAEPVIDPNKIGTPNAEAIRDSLKNTLGAIHRTIHQIEWTKGLARSRIESERAKAEKTGDVALEVKVEEKEKIRNVLDAIYEEIDSLIKTGGYKRDADGRIVGVDAPAINNLFEHINKFMEMANVMKSSAKKDMERLMNTAHMFVAFLSNKQFEQGVRVDKGLELARRVFEFEEKERMFVAEGLKRTKERLMSDLSSEVKAKDSTPISDNRFYLSPEGRSTLVRSAVVNARAINNARVLNEALSILGEAPGTPDAEAVKLGYAIVHLLKNYIPSNRLRGDIVLDAEGRSIKQRAETAAKYLDKIEKVLLDTKRPAASFHLAAVNAKKYIKTMYPNSNPTELSIFRIPLMLRDISREFRAGRNPFADENGNAVHARDILTENLSGLFYETAKDNSAVGRSVLYVIRTAYESMKERGIESESLKRILSSGELTRLIESGDFDGAGRWLEKNIDKSDVPAAIIEVSEFLKGVPTAVDIATATMSPSVVSNMFSFGESLLPRDISEPIKEIKRATGDFVSVFNLKKLEIEGSQQRYAEIIKDKYEKYTDSLIENVRSVANAMKNSVRKDERVFGQKLEEALDIVEPHVKLGELSGLVEAVRILYDKMDKFSYNAFSLKTTIEDQYRIAKAYSDIGRIVSQSKSLNAVIDVASRLEDFGEFSAHFKGLNVKHELELAVADIRKALAVGDIDGAIERSRSVTPVLDRAIAKRTLHVLSMLEYSREFGYLKHLASFLNESIENEIINIRTKSGAIAANIQNVDSILKSFDILTAVIDIDSRAEFIRRSLKGGLQPLPEDLDSKIGPTLFKLHVRDLTGKVLPIIEEKVTKAIRSIDFSKDRKSVEKQIGDILSQEIDLSKININTALKEMLFGTSGKMSVGEFLNSVKSFVEFRTPFESLGGYIMDNSVLRNGATHEVAKEIIRFMQDYGAAKTKKELAKVRNTFGVMSSVVKNIYKSIDNLDVFSNNFILRKDGTVSPNAATIVLSEMSELNSMMRLTIDSVINSGGVRFRIGGEIKDVQIPLAKDASGKETTKSGNHKVFNAFIDAERFVDETKIISGEQQNRFFDAETDINYQQLAGQLRRAIESGDGPPVFVRLLTTNDGDFVAAPLRDVDGITREMADANALILSFYRRAGVKSIPVIAVIDEASAEKNASLLTSIIANSTRKQRITTTISDIIFDEIGRLPDDYKKIANYGGSIWDAKLDTPEKAVVFSRLTRAPGIETNSVIIVDDHGRIVYSAITSDVNPFSVNPSGLIKSVESLIRNGLIKDGYTIYHVHNHPLTNIVAPSPADRKTYDFVKRYIDDVARQAGVNVRVRFGVVDKVSVYIYDEYGEGLLPLTDKEMIALESLRGRDTAFISDVIASIISESKEKKWTASVIFGGDERFVETGSGVRYGITLAEKPKTHVSLEDDGAVGVISTLSGKRNLSKIADGAIVVIDHGGNKSASDAVLSNIDKLLRMPRVTSVVVPSEFVDAQANKLKIGGLSFDIERSQPVGTSGKWSYAVLKKEYPEVAEVLYSAFDAQPTREAQEALKQRATALVSDALVLYKNGDSRKLDKIISEYEQLKRQAIEDTFGSVKNYEELVNKINQALGVQAQQGQPATSGPRKPTDPPLVTKQTNVRGSISATDEFYREYSKYLTGYATPGQKVQMFFNMFERVKFYDGLRASFAQKQGINFSQEEMPFVILSLQAGRAMGTFERIKENIVKPLQKVLDEAIDLGVKMEEINRYLIARHVPEALDHIARTAKAAVDKKIEERIAKDPTNADQIRADLLSVLQKKIEEIEGGGVAGMTRDEALKIVKEYENGPHAKLFKKIGEFVDILGEERLKLGVDYGFISDKDAAALRSAYKHYVPIVSEARSEARKKLLEIIPHPPKDFSPAEVFVERFEADIKDPKNVLAELLASTTRLIRNGEINISLLGLVRAEQKFYTGVIKLSHSEMKKVQAGLIEIESKLKQKDFAGLAEGKELTYYENGEERRMIIRDPYLARAYDAFLGANADPIIRFIGKLTRFMAAMRTVYSPEFPITNMPADVQSSFLFHAVEKGAGRAISYIRNIPSSYAEVFKALFRGIKSKDYEDYVNSGAPVSIMSGVGYNYDEALKILDKSKEVWGAREVRAFLDIIKNFNNIFEQGSRLAAFKTMKQYGHGTRESALAAKRITVNFEQRGPYTQTLGSMYMFAAADLAALERGMSIFTKENMKRAAAVTAGLVVSGAVMSLANRLLGGKDEELGVWQWDKLSPDVKDRYLNFYVGDKNGAPVYVRIRSPHFFRSFISLGQMLEDEFIAPILGLKEWGVSGPMGVVRIALRTMASFASSFNPFSTLRTESWKTFGLSLTPSVVKPIVSAVANVSPFGNPIYKQRMPWEEHKPAYELAFKGTHPAAIELSKALNELTNAAPGSRGSVDIPPEVFTYMFDEILGGVGAFISQMSGSMLLLAGKKEVPTKKMPFIRRVVYEVDEGRVVALYYKTSREVSEKMRRAQYGVDVDERYLLLGRYYKEAESQIRRLIALRNRYGEDNEDIKRDIEHKIKQIQKWFLRQYVETFGTLPEGD